MPNWFAQHKNTLLYALILALLLFLLRWFEFRFMVLSRQVELYMGGIALLFTGLGIWLALKLARPKKETIVIEKEVHIPARAAFIRNDSEMEKLGISKRELEVLQLMGEGLSNAEIAGRLFVSANTIKTHSSKIFEKLDVKRRIQAVEKARQLNIIA